LSWVRELSFSSIIDIGCGGGDLVRDLITNFPDAKITGADLSEEVVKTNQERMPQARFVSFNLEEGPLEKRYDVVICSEVVEHTDDYEAAIASLAAMTKGALILTVPCGPLFPIDRAMGHTRHFSAYEIGAALGKAGLAPVKLVKWGFPFFNLYKHAINISPERTMAGFASTSQYGLKEKVISSLVYGLFRLSAPLWGYQLFAMAQREDGHHE